MGKTHRAGRRRKQSWDNLLFDIVINVLLLLLVVVTLYPVIFVVMASFSDPWYVGSGKLLLYPHGFNVLGYQRVFRDRRVWIGYGNTILYTVGGTLFGTVVTVLAGYAFSRKDLPGRKLLMGLFVFTMYFGGGLVPSYMVLNSVGLVNTRLLMILQGGFSVYNMIMVRSFMMGNIPEELLDAAVMDGCGNGMFFVRIVAPLSKAIFAVIALYISVGHWNAYFNALVYLTDEKKYPLQVFLRQILLIATSIAEGVDEEMMRDMLELSQIMRYALIVVAMLPITLAYPFIQKYFVKGVMIGSVKG